jgi:hypothetical protein
MEEDSRRITPKDVFGTSLDSRFECDSSGGLADLGLSLAVNNAPVGIHRTRHTLDGRRVH